MNRLAPIAIALLLVVSTGCKTTTNEDTKKADVAKADATKKAAIAKPAAWHDAISGKYAGVVGGNGDAIVFEFAHVNGQLTATYEIDDPAFSAKPYKGKLMKMVPVAGRERTLSCRYEDEMNNGSYVLTFTPDLKQLTGQYEIDGEGASDANTVTATKK